MHAVSLIHEDIVPLAATEDVVEIDIGKGRPLRDRLMLLGPARIIEVR